MTLKNAILVTLVWSWGGVVYADGGVDEAVTGRAVVRVLEGIDVADFIEQFEADHPVLPLEILVIGAIPSRNTYLLDFNSKGLTEDQIEDLAEELECEFEVECEDGGIDPNCPYPTFLSWSEVDYEGEAPEGRTGTFWLSLDPPGDEALFQNQYAAEMLDLAGAHALSTGAGTVIAILDTGVDASLPLFQGRMVAGGYNFVGNNTDTSDVGDEEDTDGDVFVDEMVGHGTFVASLVALAAPDAKILAVRVLDGDGVSDNWTMAQGIYHAIDRGVEVINLSLGSTYKSRVVEDAVNEAASVGIITVAAAGNLNREEPKEYPALYCNVVGVAATDDQDLKSVFTNFNTDGELTIAAPGTTSAPAGDPDPQLAIIGLVPGGAYATWEGTSFSTAFVSAAAALVRSQHPEWPNEFVTAAGIGATLTQRSVALPYEDLMLGAGRLDVGDAIGFWGTPTPSLGDLNNDGQVRTADLLILIQDWGAVHSSADLDLDGEVGTNDLLQLLANWS